MMINTEASILSICYLMGSIAFIVGLKMLAHPDTARKGNQISAGGMALAIFATLVLGYLWDFIRPAYWRG